MINNDEGVIDLINSIIANACDTLIYCLKRIEKGKSKAYKYGNIFDSRMLALEQIDFILDNEWYYGNIDGKTILHKIEKEILKDGK